MTRDGEPPSGLSEPVQSAGSVADWIDAMAAEEGVSRDELLDDLVWSYWTLKEVVAVVERHLARSGQSARGDEAGRPGPPEDRHDVHERLRALESALDSLPDDVVAGEALRTVDAERSAFEASMTDRVAAIEGWVEAELGHARTLFEHVLDARTDADRRLDELAERLRLLTERAVERDRADRLGAAARRQDIERATCEHCGTAVEVDGLTRPVCPGCGRSAVAVEPAGGWLRLGPARLVVSDCQTPGLAHFAAADGGPGSETGAPARDVGSREPVEIEWVLPDRDDPSTPGEGGPEADNSD